MNTGRPHPRPLSRFYAENGWGGSYTATPKKTRTIQGWQYNCHPNNTAKGVRRSGLTLTELLVVTVIILALLALLLPAVQYAREASRIAVCQNNLHQIGLAFRLYVQSNRDWPCPGTKKAVSGWEIQILPYMEQKALAEAFEANPSLDPGKMSPLTCQRPAIFRCPSAEDEESTIPKVPVSHYIGGHGYAADAPVGLHDPWVISPDMPNDYQKSLGPHRGGFNVLANAETVRWEPGGLDH